MHVPQSSAALDLAQAIGVLRRRAPLVLLCVVVLAGAAYEFSKHQAKSYTTTAALSFSLDPLSQQIAGLAPSSTTNLLAQQANNLELVKLGDMAAKTAHRLGHGLTEQQVAKSLSISSAGESSVVDVSATTSSPQLAAQIANTYSAQFVAEQQAATHQSFRSALDLVERQIAKIPTKDQFSPAVAALQNRAQSLRILDESHYGNVQVAQQAPVPSTPSGPKTSKNTTLGAGLGLILGLGLAFVLERLAIDSKIRRPEDLEAVYGLPVLGAIPESRALSDSQHKRNRPATLPPAEAETFRLLRARLRFLNSGRDLRTLLVASAAAGEGKTTIARHLAEAAAGAGARVLLLEADLRHPTLARQLDIEAGPGLAEVLNEAAPLNEAIRSIDLSPLPGEEAATVTLDVLACHGTPPNPGQLIERHAMAVVLDRAKSTYDFVVIDAPPLPAVSDAFPLLHQVDGAVIVSWVGRGRRDAAELLHRTLKGSGVVEVGVIANGARRAGAGAYGHVRRGAAPTSPAPGAPTVNGASPSESVPTVKA
jgi:polysaccharide biosynthesis transport protein